MKVGEFKLTAAYELNPDGSKTALPFTTMDEAMNDLEKKTEAIEKVDVFRNQGKLVPAHIQERALAHVQEMMPETDPELHRWIVGKAASLIEKDMVYAILNEVSILDEGLAKLDLTGRYRPVAVLLNY